MKLVKLAHTVVNEKLPPAESVGKAKKKTTIWQRIAVTLLTLG